MRKNFLLKLLLPKYLVLKISNYSLYMNIYTNIYIIYNTRLYTYVCICVSIHTHIYLYNLP